MIKQLLCFVFRRRRLAPAPRRLEIPGQKPLTKTPAACVISETRSFPAAADWVFHSGRIFDGLRLHPAATAVAVTDGVITAVGTDADVRMKAGPAGESVNLDGRLLVPGFTDAHVHTVMAGIERLGCDLSSCTGAGDVLDRIAGFAAASSNEWITGGGWHKADFPGGYPTRQALDAVVADRPVYLVNADHPGAGGRPAGARG